MIWRPNAPSKGPSPRQLPPGSSAAGIHLPPRYQLAANLIIATLLLYLIAAGLGFTAYIAVGSLAALVWLAFTSDRPPVLLWIGCSQWLQAGLSTIVASEDYRSFRLSTASAHDFAQNLSLVAVICLLAGISKGLSPKRQAVRRVNSEDSLIRPAPGVVSPPRAYLTLLLISVSITPLLSVLSPLRAIASTLPVVRLAALTAWAYTQFQHTNQHKKLFWLALLGEALASMSGMFFGLRRVVAFLLIAWLAATFDGRRRLNLVTVFAVVALVIFPALAWTSVKSNYRATILEANSQVYHAGPLDRLAALRDEVLRIGADDFADASGAALRRISYVDYFGLTVERVPGEVSYASGRIWLDALLRALQPRLLFPGKSAVNDSDRTRHYTGVNVAGVDEGSSISLGYPCESYIDFGPLLMFLPIILLGFLVGRAVRSITGQLSKASGYRVSVAVLILLPLESLETSVTKSVPALGLHILMAWAFSRWLRRL